LYRLSAGEARRIRSLVAVTRGCIIEVGRELAASRFSCLQPMRTGAGVLYAYNTGTLLDRGYGNQSGVAEFGWTEDTAQRYMRVAKAVQMPQRAVFDGLTIDAGAHQLCPPKMAAHKPSPIWVSPTSSPRNGNFRRSDAPATEIRMSPNLGGSLGTSWFLDQTYHDVTGRVARRSIMTPGGGHRRGS
jgi:hypothetical protein